MNHSRKFQDKLIPAILDKLIRRRVRINSRPQSVIQKLRILHSTLNAIRNKFHNGTAETLI